MPERAIPVDVQLSTSLAPHLWQVIFFDWILRGCVAIIAVLGLAAVLIAKMRGIG